MDQDLKRIITESLNEMDLNEFRVYNQSLCPDLWDEYQHLDPRVRVNLLRLAYDFYKKTKFVAPIVDVWLMGSIANYNWTPESDVDVHILIDFSQLKMPPETASKVAKSAGASWNQEHNVMAKNHKVEINIQSVKAEKPYVMGIYSLVKDEWVRKPCQVNPQINKSLIQQKYSEMKKCIDAALQSEDREKMKEVKDYLDDYRQYGLDHGGELSTENIVYKILRSKGLVKTLKDTITQTYDREMTVAEVDKSTPVASDYIGGIIQGEVRGEPVEVGKALSYMHSEFPGIYSGQNNTNWRYLSAKNQILWNLEPDPEDKPRVEDFLAKRGIVKPSHKAMYTYNESITEAIRSIMPGVDAWDMENRTWILDKLTIENLQSLRKKMASWLRLVRKKPEPDPTEIKQLEAAFRLYDTEFKKRLGRSIPQNDVREGVGWGLPKDIKKDPLHIPGERWRIKWYSKRKTPKMKNEEFVNKIAEQEIKKMFGKNE